MVTRQVQVNVHTSYIIILLMSQVNLFIISGFLEARQAVAEYVSCSGAEVEAKVIISIA